MGGPGSVCLVVYRCLRGAQIRSIHLTDLVASGACPDQTSVQPAPIGEQHTDMHMRDSTSRMIACDGNSHSFLDAQRPEANHMQLGLTAGSSMAQAAYRNDPAFCERACLCVLTWATLRASSSGRAALSLEATCLSSCTVASSLGAATRMHRQRLLTGSMTCTPGSLADSSTMVLCVPPVCGVQSGRIRISRPSQLCWSMAKACCRSCPGLTCNVPDVGWRELIELAAGKACMGSVAFSSGDTLRQVASIHCLQSISSKITFMPGCDQFASTSQLTNMPAQVPVDIVLVRRTMLSQA